MVASVSFGWTLSSTYILFLHLRGTQRSALPPVPSSPVQERETCRVSEEGEYLHFLSFIVRQDNQNEFKVTVSQLFYRSPSKLQFASMTRYSLRFTSFLQNLFLFKLTLEFAEQIEFFAVVSGLSN